LKDAGYHGETVELLVHSSLTDQVKATVLQAQLKKIGMAVKLVLVDTGEYRDRPRRGDFQLYFSGGSVYPDPGRTYSELKCGPDLKKRSLNTPGYCDKEMDALLDAAEKEVNPEKRKALYKQIVGKVVADVPEVYLGYIPQFFALRDYVKGFTTDSDGNFGWWGGGLNYTWLDK
jgi:peptide/nickel transport system substrate-binding protein